jgi:hypothetical protein
MHKLFLTLSAAAILAVGSASAQAPTAPVMPGPVMPPVYGDSYYGGSGHGFFGGLLGGYPGGMPHSGFLSGLFKNHGSGRNGGPPQTLPVATGGTLVFPQNPFVRSPRDFFMYDR